MQRFLDILIALLVLGAIHSAFSFLSKRARGVGNAVGRAARPGVRALLTKYDRRKVVRQMQEQRKKAGLPPLENPEMD